MNRNHFPNHLLFVIILLISSVSHSAILAWQTQQPQQSAVVTSTKVRSPLVPTSTAIKQFEERVTRFDGDLGSRSILGQLYLRRAKEEDRFHDYIEAEKQFAKILEIQPDHPSANTLLAYAYLSQHRFKEARDLTKQLLTSAPNDPTNLAICSDAQMQLGEYAEAKQNIDKLLASSRKPGSLVRLSAYQQTFGQTSQALESINEAVSAQMQLGDTAKNNAWYFLRYAQVLFDVGQLENAKSQIDKALRAVEDYPQALVLLAQIESAQGNLDEAISLYKRALQSSEEPPTLARLGDLLIRLGQTNEAKGYHAQAEKLMSEEESDPVAGPPHARERAIYYSNHNQKLKHAIKLAADDLDVRNDIVTHDTMAWALYQNKEHEKALTHSRLAIATGTKDADILFHAGRIELANGNVQRGRTLLEGALQANPHFSFEASREIRKLLEEGS